VTYGAPATVTITLAGGMYTEIAKTPVEVTGSSCDLPVDTIISTFTQTGQGTYAGKHGLWFTSNCSFATWADVTLTLTAGGNRLIADIKQENAIVAFTKT